MHGLCVQTTRQSMLLPRADLLQFGGVGLGTRIAIISAPANVQHWKSRRHSNDTPSRCCTYSSAQHRESLLGTLLLYDISAFVQQHTDRESAFVSCFNMRARVCILHLVMNLRFVLLHRWSIRHVITEAPHDRVLFNVRFCESSTTRRNFLYG